MRDCDHVLIVDCPRSSIICVIDSGSFSNSNRTKTKTNKQANKLYMCAMPCSGFEAVNIVLHSTVCILYIILALAGERRASHLFTEFTNIHKYFVHSRIAVVSACPSICQDAVSRQATKNCCSEQLWWMLGQGFLRTLFNSFLANYCWPSGIR